MIPESARRLGRFLVEPGRPIVGELTLDGPDTLLILHDEEFFHAGALADGRLTGELYDLTKITLLDCLSPGSGSRSHGPERRYFAEVFPHFVVEGRRHLFPTENVITDISVLLDDAPTLFYDFDAFGSVIDAPPHIEEIANANFGVTGRPVEVGEDPLISYFTGKHLIVAVETAIGTVSASHRPSWSLGGPRGVRIDNVIALQIRTETPINFSEAIDRVLQLVRFVEVIVGRPQNIDELSIGLAGPHGPEWLRVHWSHRPARRTDNQDKENGPHQADMPLDPIRRRDEFAKVMGWWFEKDRARQHSRGQFLSCLRKQNQYTVDRLVAAANMFDLLPSEAVPSVVDLTPEVRKAKDDCQAIFKALPDCDERSSVLNALGRVGKANLKQKVRHRARLITSIIGEKFPEIDLVLNAAVDCRNHYVHGTPTKLDYEREWSPTGFLNDTLEFVFAAAELVEGGWDIRAFLENPTTQSHPFGRFRVNYTSGLQKLKDLLSTAADKPLP